MIIDHIITFLQIRKKNCFWTQNQFHDQLAKDRIQNLFLDKIPLFTINLATRTHKICFRSKT